MRTGRVLLLSLLILLACARENEDKAASFEGAPIVLISIDTLRSDRLPVYGYAGVATPNLDALARDSVVFQRAYSHCPMTLPSHASIFTGLLPTEHGVRNNVGYSFDGTKHRTLATILRERGYRTGAAVSSYVLRSDTGIADGFDDYDDSIPVAAGALSEHQRSGFETLAHATKWIDANAANPFFYFFHIYEPHAPYTPPEPYRSQTKDPYDGEIAAADAIVGRLLDHLKARGLYDRALIVLLSDHGEGLWDHGEDQHGILLYREALQVPLFIKLPNGERKGTTISHPVGLAGVFATLLGEKTSLLGDSPATPVYAETFYPRIHLGWSELRSLVDSQHHYIDGPRPELFDVVADPAEKKDLVAQERRVTASMRQKMASYPASLAALEPVDPEEAKKLAALGYVGSPQDRSGPLPNPRDEIGNLAAIKQAFRLADERRYDEAAGALRALLDRNPRLSDVWSKLGEVLVESGRYDEAIVAYQTAIARAERFSPDLALGLGLAFLEAGKPNEAMQHADLAMKTSPREAHELTARALASMHRTGEAEAHARAAIALSDRQPSSLLLLAEVQRAAGRFDAALRSVDEATARARELSVEHLYGADYLRGDLLARLDRPADAIAAYRREIDASPQHLQSYANLALIYLIEEKKSDANRTLEEMVRRNPHRGAYLLAARTLEALEDSSGAARWRARGAAITKN